MANKDIDKSLKMFTDALHEAAKPMKKGINRGATNHHPKPKWFDKDCI